MMITAVVAATEAGPQPRHGNMSSDTTANGKSNRKCSGTRWEKRLDGQPADADMCKSLSCSPWTSAMNQ